MEEVPIEHAMARVEWEAWQKVVQASKETVITEADWRTGVGSHPETPGLRLIKAIQEWGDRLAALRVQQTREKEGW